MESRKSNLVNVIYIFNVDGVCIATYAHILIVGPLNVTVGVHNV